MKYIDIDSTYRDRTRFPNPANFVVFNNISNCSSTNNYIDPVSFAAIKYPDTNNLMYAYPISNAVSNQLEIEPLIYQSNNFYFVDDIPAVQNVFNNNILELFNDDPEVNGGLITSSFYTITDTIYQSNTDSLEQGAVYAAINTAAAVFPNILLSFYLSNSSSDINGYYIGKTVTINGDTRNILDYDGGNRLATVDVQLSAAPAMGDAYVIYTTSTWTLVVNKTITPTVALTYPSSNIHNVPAGRYRNLYRIREDIPYFQGTAVAGTINHIAFSSNASAADDAYVNRWISITNQTRDIASGVITSVTYSISPATYGEYSTALPTLVGILTTAGIDPANLDNYTFAIQIPAWGDFLLRLQIASVVDATHIYVYTGLPIGFAAGDLFWISMVNPIVNESFKIIAYDGATKTATINQSFSSAVVTGDTFDVLTINKDNFTSLSIFSDKFLSSQEVCYEITLHTLTLPNIPIQNGYGNLIAFYPYIYLEFSSATSSTYNNIYITNTPNITKRLFKVPIYNVNTPLESTFIVLNGLGMKQTVKFRPQDDFRITIYLPNGEILEYSVLDTLPPVLPLPDVQISLTLCIRRV